MYKVRVANDSLHGNGNHKKGSESQAFTLSAIHFV